MLLIIPHVFLSVYNWVQSILSHSFSSLVLTPTIRYRQSMALQIPSKNSSVWTSIWIAATIVYLFIWGRGLITLYSINVFDCSYAAALLSYLFYSSRYCFLASICCSVILLFTLKFEFFERGPQLKCIIIVIIIRNLSCNSPAISG